MVAYWLSGTPPRNTSVSVPRLTPVRKVRTSTSSGPGSGTQTGRISPTPGLRSQNASASRGTSSPFHRHRAGASPAPFYLRTPRHEGTVRWVHPRPVLGLVAQVALLSASVPRSARTAIVRLGPEAGP